MPNRPKQLLREVVVSHPVHQHAYETAVAAQDAGLLRWFATGMYRTGRGLSNPALLRLLPGGMRVRIERLQRRRWHPDLRPAKVVTIPGPQLISLLARHSALGPTAERWSHERFDLAVGRRLLREKPSALIHAFEGAAVQTFRAAKRLGLPTILDVTTAHEYFLTAFETEGLSDIVPKSVTAGVKAERELADHILVPSAFVARCLSENGVPEHKVIRLPYGADTNLFKPSVRSDSSFRALFVGQIGLRKGVRYLLEAWRRLELNDSELVLVGPCVDSGAQLLSSRPSNCRWIGQVPKYEVHHWFRNSDVFVFPSLAEGSAYVTYEAMAAGLPVVTTENSGSVARDGQEGFIVPAGDVNALEKKIKLLFDDPDLRARMASQARRLIEANYSWRHYRARLAIVYRAVLEGRSPQLALAATQLSN